MKYGVSMKKVAKKKKLGFMRRNKKRIGNGSSECVNQLLVVPMITLNLTPDDEGSSSVENSRPNSVNLSKPLSKLTSLNKRHQATRGDVALDSPSVLLVEGARVVFESDFAELSFWLLSAGEVILMI
ncbi:hypothetical protein JTB14_031034 [Gonioctena quinquepunctata]|nr:hypothetical protein JTB14_031034 [Gonioctena quinquepunctata]